MWVNRRPTSGADVDISWGGGWAEWSIFGVLRVRVERHGVERFSGILAPATGAVSSAFFVSL